MSFSRKELLGNNKVGDSNRAKSNSRAGSSYKDLTKKGKTAVGTRQKQYQDIDEGEEQEIQAILNFRASQSKKGAIELLVHWAGETVEEATWESEEEIQKGATETVYNYWKTKGGRGRALFQDLRLPEEYRVFQILGYKKHRGGFQLEVQWVGYSDSPIDTTWEPEAKLKTAARGLLDEY